MHELRPRLILGTALTVVLVACSRSSGAVPDASFGVDTAAVSAEDLIAAGVEVNAGLGEWPAPKVATDIAVTVAEEQLSSPKEHGPLLTVGRGTAKQFEDPMSPVRTVWVVAYGAGGKVPIQGPAGGSQPVSVPIALQLVLIDDQTGEFLRGYVKSGP